MAAVTSSTSSSTLDPTLNTAASLPSGEPSTPQGVGSAAESTIESAQTPAPAESKGFCATVTGFFKWVGDSIWHGISSVMNFVKGFFVKAENTNTENQVNEVEQTHAENQPTALEALHTLVEGGLENDGIRSTFSALESDLQEAVKYKMFVLASEDSVEANQPQPGVDDWAGKIIRNEGDANANHVDLRAADSLFRRALQAVVQEAAAATTPSL